MKKLAFIALIALAKSAFAQKDTVGLNIPYINNTVVYEQVYNAPNTPQNLLYSNAGLWLAETHPYVADTQLKLSDPAIWRVVGRAKVSDLLGNKVLWQTIYYRINFDFTVQIDCKDNKYRVRIYNIQDVFNNIYTPVDNLMLALIDSKSYQIDTGAVLNTTGLKEHFRALNSVVNNIMADIAKEIMVDNSF